MIEYLLTATPRFHIQGKHVEMDYSSPQGATRSNSSAAQSAAGIAAAQAAIQVQYFNIYKNITSTKCDKFTSCKINNFSFVIQATQAAIQVQYLNNLM